MLPYFDNVVGLDQLSENARSRLDWLLITLYARHPIENPITARTIFKMTEVKKLVDGHWKIVRKGLSGVDVRKMINILRDNLFPIGSRGNGYYWVFNDKDWEPTFAHYQHRIDSAEHTLSCMKKSQQIALKEGKVRRPDDGQPIEYYLKKDSDNQIGMFLTVHDVIRNRLENNNE